MCLSPVDPTVVLVRKKRRENRLIAILLVIKFIHASTLKIRNQSRPYMILKSRDEPAFIVQIICKSEYKKKNDYKYRL